MFNWLAAYFARNNSLLLQALFFVFATDSTFFKQESPKKRAGKDILAFLLSFNTSTLLTVLLYDWLSARIRFNQLGDFIIAILAVFIPLIPLVAVYQKLIGKKYPVAVFCYGQFVVAAQLATLLADTVFQRLIWTIVLTLFLYFEFYHEIDYLASEQTVLTNDLRFPIVAWMCIYLIVTMAKFPRMFLNGAIDSEATPISLALGFIALVTLLMYTVFMKFNIFSITRYENYLRGHDNDSLTGVKSLAYLLTNAPGLLKGRKVKVFYTSISNFHDYNLIHGYQAGTKILQETADMLTAAFPNTLLIRYGGTHFIGINQDFDARRFDMIARKLASFSTGEALSFKVGIAQMPSKSSIDDAHRTTELLNTIDRAAGAVPPFKKKETVGIYDGELAKAEEVRVHVLNTIDEATKADWLKNYYQPVIDIQSGKLHECEALSRWIDPQYGFLTPDKFIPVLEENRTIYKVDLHNLERYGKDTQELRKKGKDIFPISFNISRTDLETIDVFSAIEQIVNDYQLDRSKLHVEITESALNDNSDAMIRAVNKFHELGYEVWMDDFGSGYSSLNVLKDYHFDVIKIDMIFLRNFDERSQEIIKSVCEMAKGLGIQTVCEGVETQAEFDFLKETGCDYAQGFLFSPPIPLKEVYSKLGQRM
ncbi:EAL domain-containing protein [Lactobacillus porci]|nr:GGDEF domain-containing phosphodiesterase [Lactobacillus porci]